jgi:hypothetical protein
MLEILVVGASPCLGDLALGGDVQDIWLAEGPHEVANQVRGGGHEFGGVAGEPFERSLDGLWRRLGIDATMKRLLTGRRMDARVERALFALVANRALAPSSQLAATELISADVHIDGLAVIDEQACYRAMDWLAEIEPVLAKDLYFR